VALKRRERQYLKSDVPATVHLSSLIEGVTMVAVMIGVDPHKGSHTAAAIDSTETDLGGVRVRACKGQLERLLEWAGWFGSAELLRALGNAEFRLYSWPGRLQRRTSMKIPQFAYHCPESVPEALVLLGELGDEAKVLAGGQSLLPLMALRLSRPAHVIDIGHLSELTSLSVEDGALRVGAMVRHAELERSDIVREIAPLVAGAMPLIGHRAIRNRGTACGSLAHGDPAAELPAVSVAVGAEFRLQGASGERTVPASDFFTGYLTNAIESDELLVEWRLPSWSATAGWSIQEVSRRHGDFALLGCAAVLDCTADGTVATAAVAFFGAGSTPVRLPEAEKMLIGQKPVDDLIASVGEAIRSELNPPGDLHATVAYRRHLGGVLARRCLQEAAGRMKVPA
jgi:carbon-monoxide dehydrogenase medium subunit